MSCFNLSIIPAMPGNCRAFDSTFERQGEFIHLPVGDMSRAFGRFYHKNGPTVQGIYWALHPEKLKSPLFTRPVGDMVTNYWCIKLHSVSITRGGGVLRWRKASLSHVTRNDSVEPPQTLKP